MVLEYEDGDVQMTTVQLQQLVPVIAGMTTKPSLRQLIVSKWGEELVLELDWRGNVATAIASLLQHLAGQRKLYSFFASEAYSSLAGILLGSGVLKIKEEDNDHVIVDTPRAMELQEGVVIFDHLVGTLCQIFRSEDAVREFVQSNMKLIKNKIIYEEGLVVAVKSLLTYSIRRQRFGRLIEKVYNGAGRGDLMLPALAGVLATNSMIRMRNGGTFSI
jgi:hypothetical protein